MSTPLRNFTHRDAFMQCLLTPERAEWNLKTLQGEIVAMPTNPAQAVHFGHDQRAIAEATPEDRAQFERYLGAAAVLLQVNSSQEV